MIVAPTRLGNTPLSRETLAEDKKQCLKIGPVGMSKGGFTGKGIFATTPYLVVQRSDGTEQQCNFKIEAEVDEVLEEIHKKHPEIPVYSAESEKKLRKAKAEQEARYLKKLPENALETIQELERAKAYLQKDERFSKLIVFAAKQKRSLDGTKTSLKTLAALIDAGSAVLIAAGLYLRLMKGNSMGIYLALFGGAFILSVAASQILPTPHRNRKTAQADRAADAEGALETVKKDLKALNSSVTVSQQEYDEVVTIKPLFIVSDYQ